MLIAMNLSTPQLYHMAPSRSPCNMRKVVQAAIINICIVMWTIVAIGKRCAVQHAVALQ